MQRDPHRGSGAARMRGALSALASSEHLATEAVVAYVDGELSMTAHQRAAAHLSSCAECSADVDAQQRTRLALRSAPMLTMPLGLRSLLFSIPDGNASPVAAATPRIPPALRPGAIVAHADGGFVAVLKPVPQPSAEAPGRSRRPFPLAVITVTALAVGVLGAAAMGGGGSTPDRSAISTVPRGTTVVPASTVPRVHLATTRIEFLPTGPAQTRTSP